jgi:hypothetical protein
MVVSPMDALADVAAYWTANGGGWNPADAIHFELPGASEWAKGQGEPGLVQSAADWFNSLPWYVTALLPISLMTDRSLSAEEWQARNPSLFAYIKSLL